MNTILNHAVTLKDVLMFFGVGFVVIGSIIYCIASGSSKG